MKRTLLILSILAAISSVYAQNVNIPDANFKAYLVGNTAINTNMDTEIQVSEANSYSLGINCGGLGITNLTGIEAFVNLLSLTVTSNPITSVNLSQNVDLVSFWGNSTQLTNLDLSQNPALTNLNLFNCFQLTTLNVANGNNTNVVQFNTWNTSNLTCIEVDDAIYSIDNWTSIHANNYFSEDCMAGPCIVNIPDANFKAYLVGNTAINTNLDTEIQCTEAVAYSGSMIVSNLSISDLTGIEAFVNITALNCNNNSLTALDVSANTELVELYCESNTISNLNLNSNVDLVWLSVAYNDLSTLDLSTNAALNSLSFHYNQIASLDITNNTSIEYINGQYNGLTTFTKGVNNSLNSLYLGNNLLTTVDASNLPALYTLSLLNNSVATLNVNNCPNLTYLYIQNNNLTTIDLSSALALASITCSGNLFTSLDLSDLQFLNECICENNELTSLNVKNGNNSVMSTNYFKTTGNPDLICIEVDDVLYSTTNWTFVDTWSTFTTDCITWLGTDEIDQNNLSVYPNPVIDVINLSVDFPIESATIFDVNGQVMDTFYGSTYSANNLAAGVYFIAVKSEQEISKIKFIKL